MRMLNPEDVAERLEETGVWAVAHDDFQMDTDLNNVAGELTVRGLSREDVELLLKALWTDPYEIQSSETEDQAHEVALEEAG